MTHAGTNCRHVPAAAGGCHARTFLAAVVLGCAAAAARGDDLPGSPVFTLHGFGTLSAVHSDQNRSDLVSSVYLQPNGAGATSAWSMAVDSKAGVQLDARFGPRLSAVLQVVSKHRYDNSWTPEIEWANVKYQFTPELSARLGRTVAPMFMRSDTANVGYTNPWLRGPQEIYGMVPITHLDGVDLAWNVPVGPVRNAFQANFGYNKFKAVDGVEITGKNAWIVSDTVEYEDLTLRLSYLAVDLTFDSADLDSLFNGLSGVGDNLTAAGFPVAGSRAYALGNRYRLDDTPLEIFSVGARFDPGDWLLMGEWARLTDAGVLPKTQGWYVTGGYRFGKTTPYLTVAELNSETPRESGIPLAGLPSGPLSGAGDALNRGLGVVLNMAAPSQKSLTLGLRWDLLDSAALKFEYEHVRLDDLSGGRFGNLQPGFKPGGDADLFSIALDFVF
ncbi:MAG: hypothetical protein WAV22_14535 [Porticoccaceae bacterium]